MANNVYPYGNNYGNQYVYPNTYQNQFGYNMMHGNQCYPQNQMTYPQGYPQQYANYPQNNQNGYVQQQYSQQQIPQNYQSEVQTQSQQTQNQGIPGKIVENIDQVKVTEIPLGASAIFPQADMSVIYLKQWTPDAKTKIISYIPVVDAENTEEKQVFEQIDYSNYFTELQNKIDDLDKKISTLM